MVSTQMPVHPHCIYRYHLTGTLILLSASAKAVLTSLLSLPARYQVHFNFIGFKSFSQNWQKIPPQTKDYFTYHKMQSLQVWVKPAVQQHRATPQCNGVVMEKGKRCCVQGELQDEQREEDCLIPNSWNMDYLERSNIVSNRMMFTSVLHNQTPMQSRRHPSDSCLLLKHIRTLFADLLSRY